MVAEAADTGKYGIEVARKGVTAEDQSVLVHHLINDERAARLPAVDNSTVEVKKGDRLA